MYFFAQSSEMFFQKCPGSFDMIDLVSVPRVCSVLCEVRDSSAKEHVAVETVGA